MIKFTRDLIANIAQIIEVVILLPGVCFILSLLTGTKDTLLLLLNMVGEIEIFNSFMNVVSFGVQCQQPGAVGEQFLMQLALYFENLDQSIYELFAIAVCVGLFNILGKIIRMRGMPILTSLIGVFCGYYVAKYFPMPIMTVAFLMLLTMVLDLIFVQKPNLNILKFFVGYLKSGIKMTVNVMSTIFMTGFVAVLLVIWQGGVTNVGMILFMIVMFALPWFIMALLDRYLLS